jgi:hypothetical protein
LDKHRLSNEELSVFGKMATDVRKRFELDLQLLPQPDGNPNSKESIEELVRAVKLRRNVVKFQNRGISSFQAAGFEGGYRITKKKMLRRC